MYRLAESTVASFRKELMGERRRWRAYLLGLLMLSLMYLMLYIALRMVGVFVVYYGPDGLEVASQSESRVLDAAFGPLRAIEMELKSDGTVLTRPADASEDRPA